MTPLLSTPPPPGVLGRQHHVWLPTPHKLGLRLCPQLLPDDQRDDQHLDSLPAHLVSKGSALGSDGVPGRGRDWTGTLAPAPEQVPGTGTSCGASWRWVARASPRSPTTCRCWSSYCPPASTPSHPAARTPLAPCRPVRATSATSWTTGRSASTAWVS